MPRRRSSWCCSSPGRYGSRRCSLRSASRSPCSCAPPIGSATTTFVGLGSWRCVPACSPSGSPPFPTSLYGVVNKVFDRSFLPNSIMAKGAQARRGLVPQPREGARGVGVGSDPRDPRARSPWRTSSGSGVSGKKAHTRPRVATLVVALVAQGMWGDVGWWGRYQAYLVVLGVVRALPHGPRGRGRGRGPPGPRPVPRHLRRRLVGPARAHDRHAAASSNTFRQRYQLGKFFARHYRGESVATGELGYTTLFHDGPVLDLLGLGSYEIAVAMRDHDGEVPVRTVAALLRDRDVKAIGVYPATLGVCSRPRRSGRPGNGSSRN